MPGSSILCTSDNISKDKKNTWKLKKKKIGRCILCFPEFNKQKGDRNAEVHVKAITILSYETAFPS